METTLRLGMIGLDTSHAKAFTKLLNDPADAHHVPGGRVVAAYPGGSADFPLSIERVGGFTQELREHYGVSILETPEAVAEAVDALLIEFGRRPGAFAAASRDRAFRQAGVYRQAARAELAGGVRNGRDSAAIRHTADERFRTAVCRS